MFKKDWKLIINHSYREFILLQKTKITILYKSYKLLYASHLLQRSDRLWTSNMQMYDETEEIAENKKTPE